MRPRKHNRFLRVFLITFTLSLLFNITYAQPSWVCPFNFKMYGDNGEVMDYNEFMDKFELLGEGNRDDVTPWRNRFIKKKYFYIDSTQYFHARGSVVYGPLVRKFIHKQDTMELVIPGMFSNYRGTTVDSLVFRPGKYYLPSDTIPYIDFEKAAKAYYRRFVEGIILDIPADE